MWLKSHEALIERTIFLVNLQKANIANINCCCVFFIVNFPDSVLAALKVASRVLQLWFKSLFYNVFLSVSISSYG